MVAVVSATSAIALQFAVASASAFPPRSKYDVVILGTGLKECLLSNHELIKLLTKIMTVCLLFSEQIEHFTESNRVDEFSSSPRGPEPEDAATRGGRETRHTHSM